MNRAYESGSKNSVWRITTNPHLNISACNNFSRGTGLETYFFLVQPISNYEKYLCLLWGVVIAKVFDRIDRD